MLTVNQVAKKFNLSRSTLLYYDKINLLKPSARSASNYRLYSNDDVKKMQKISVFKEAGISLEIIADILHSKDSKPANILEQRLIEVNQEIAELRRQQRHIVGLLGKDSLVRSSKTMTKDQWVTLLKASGMDDEAMHNWHIKFERDLPEMHQDFLESLGCSSEEIESIRAWSRNDKANG